MSAMSCPGVIRQAVAAWSLRNGQPNLLTTPAPCGAKGGAGIAVPEQAHSVGSAESAKASNGVAWRWRCKPARSWPKQPAKRRAEWIRPDQSGFPV